MMDSETRKAIVERFIAKCKKYDDLAVLDKVKIQLMQEAINEIEVEKALRLRGGIY